MAYLTGSFIGGLVWGVLGPWLIGRITERLIASYMAATWAAAGIAVVLLLPIYATRPWSRDAVTASVISVVLGALLYVRDRRILHAKRMAAAEAQKTQEDVTKKRPEEPDTRSSRR